MAVIISNGATNLNTASGFYRVEASNLAAYSGTALALTSTRTIALTYANAGNAQGIVIAVTCSSSTKDVTVTLKQSGTIRASKTLTASDISNASGVTAGHWLVPFTFTAPYAVTTAAGVWTLEITQGAGTGDWSVVTSNGTAPFYAAWCDNAVTFADNDTVICKDIVTVTATATVKATVGTGDAVNGTAIWVCKSDSPPTKTNNVAKLQFTPAAATTFSVDGLIGFGSHSAIQAGTSTSSVLNAAALTLDFITVSVGSAYGWKPISNNQALRTSVMMYGEVPATQQYTLTAQASIGASSFSVASTTGISIGDVFVLTKNNSTGASALTYYTVTGTTATTVSITPNIATYDKLIGGVAYKVNGFGINWVRSTVSGTPNFNFGPASNFYLIGVRFNITGNTIPSLGFTYSSLSQSFEPAAYRSKYEITKCVRGSNSVTWIGNAYVPYEGISITYCQSFTSMTIMSNVQQNDSWETGTLTEQNNYSGLQFSSGRQAGANGYPVWDIQNNFFESFALGSLRGRNSTVKNNYFKGGSGGGWQFYLSNFLNCTEWSGNTWDGCPTAIRFEESTINLTMKNELGLNSPGSSSFFYPVAGCNLINVVMENPNFVPSISTANQLIVIEGTRLAITNSNSVTNADSSWFRTGEIVRTGTSLADTTVRTAGGFAMRFMPISSTQLLKWEQTIPIGDISTKTMTITCWVYINNAAYYAGTHTKPTLSVNYDNGTTLSSVATGATGWQQLAVTFTPATSYGQVTVKVTGATDATGTNRYFYVDDVNVAYPAGYQVDLGSLDLWAAGLPVAPTIATMPSISGIWSVPESVAKATPGSIGKSIALTNVLAKDSLS